MTIYGPDLETEGTDPYEDSIITIQYRDGDAGENYLYKRWEYDSELDLIFDFIMDYKDITWVRKNGGPLRVGYRVTDFDLPFLVTRCYETEIFDTLRAGPGFFWNNVVGGPSYLDLSHLLGADMVPFEAWRGEFLGSESPSAGGEMPVLYANGDYDKIEEYVIEELEALEAVFLALSETDHFQNLLDMRRSIGYQQPLE